MPEVGASALHDDNVADRLQGIIMRRESHEELLSSNRRIKTGNLVRRVSTDALDKKLPSDRATVHDHIKFAKLIEAHAFVERRRSINASHGLHDVRWSAPQPHGIGLKVHLQLEVIAKIAGLPQPI